MGHTGEQGLEEAVLEALRPSWSEIVRAKRAILELVADGQPHGVALLQGCLFGAEDVPPYIDRNEKLTVASDEVIDSVVTRRHPLIAHHRLALAASEAIVDLFARGILVEVAEAPDYTTSHSLVAQVVIGYQYRNRGGGVRPSSLLPNLARAYRLAPHLAHDDVQWFADPDVFTADLDELQLDRRTRRCIDEALNAYRNGLYLSAANMLGAASEGAWYAAGERLRHLDRPLANALSNDQTTKVMTRVAYVLRQWKDSRRGVDSLQAQAALLVELRNYGVHPRGDETDHLEQYFTDTGAAMLLMESYSYFVRLADAVERQRTADE